MQVFENIDCFNCEKYHTGKISPFTISTTTLYECNNFMVLKAKYTNCKKY